MVVEDRLCSDLDQGLELDRRALQRERERLMIRTGRGDPDFPRLGLRHAI